MLFPTGQRDRLDHFQVCLQIVDVVSERTNDRQKVGESVHAATGMTHVRKCTTTRIQAKLCNAVD
jgi:hypothetical protein